MAYQLFQLPKAQAFASGRVAPGAKLSFYLTGTSTPTPVYTTSALTTTHTQPVTADSAGVFPAIYLDPTISYKATYQEFDDSLLYTVDPANDQLLSQTVVGAYLYPRTSAEIAASVTPTYYYYPPGDIRRYGAVSGGSAATNRAAIQAAINANSSVFIPDGTFDIDATIYWRSDIEIRFASTAAKVKANITSAIFAGPTPTVTRPLRVRMYSGTIDGTAKTNAGSIALDCTSTAMFKAFGTFITNVETGWKNGGTGSLGAYYNELHGCDMSTVVTGVNNGTLGNDNKMIGGRVNDSTTGTRDNDCTGNCYFGVAIETFATVAHLNSDTAAATNIKYICSRMENPTSSGTGIDIRSAAQVCNYIFPQFTNVATPISDASSTDDTNGISDVGGWVIKGGTAIQKHFGVTVTYDMPSLGAATFRQDGPITVTGVAVGDAVAVSLPAAFPNNIIVGVPIVTATNTLYLPVYNPSGGAVDPASGSYYFAWDRH